MKTKTILLLICLFSITSKAQSQLFKGGILAGLNGSQVDGDSYFGYNKLGFMGGIYIYTPLSAHVDIQLEMEYMGKGAKSVATESNPVEYKSQLNYFEMPIILRYNTKKKIGLESGLGFGYLISSSETLSVGSPTKQNPFKHFELSFIAGMTYKINDQFTALARYSYSVLEIAPTFTDPNLIILTSGMYNNLFTIGITYEIGRK